VIECTVAAGGGGPTDANEDEAAAGACRANADPVRTEAALVALPKVVLVPGKAVDCAGVVVGKGCALCRDDARADGGGARALIASEDA
jgi:hypothetical protein